MKKIELLAPAKNYIYGIEAINCGADAVYIGADEFGARKSASNSIKEIEKLIKYAHKFSASVYVTINTIIYDNEIKKVQKLISDLYNIGTDALIIQDMGILEMEIPPIPLHASTQTNNLTAEKINFLQKVGFDRAILARELNLDEIKKISKSTDIELEAFVHGALCISYSGQCYLSHYIGKRSSNRGECAQPCRKLYSLADENNNIDPCKKHFLSLKDMNRSDCLEELIDAGISSLKIEGRLKDLNYLKNVTAFYRKKLDQVINNKNLVKSSKGNITYNFNPNINKTFNRGFTNYFLTNSDKAISSMLTPKFVGEEIGTIIDINNENIEIKTKHNFKNGDGITFFNKKNQLQGFNISKFLQNKIYIKNTGGYFINQKIYLNHDKAFYNSIEKSNCIRKLSFSLEITDKDDKIFFKFFNNDDDYLLELTKDNFNNFTINKADNYKDRINKSFSKTGETIFSINMINIRLKAFYDLKTSEMNELRRKIYSDLEEKILLGYKNKKIKVIPNNAPFYKKEVSYKDNISNKLAIDFYKRHGVKNFEKAFELLNRNEQGNKILMTTKYCLRKELNICSRKNLKPSPSLMLVSDMGDKLRLDFDCNNCQMHISIYSNKE